MNDAAPVDAGSGRERTVVITGELDRSTRDQISTLVRDTITPDTVEVGLDLSGVEFIDCAGLTAILTARRQAMKSGCHVYVATPSPATLRLFRLTDTMSLLQPS